MAWVLAVDLGNGGPKVAAVHADGSLGPTSQRTVGVDIGMDGRATQDAGEWWPALVECIREVVGQMEAEPASAVGITGQWGSTVPVDEHGEPVGPVLLWADTRARPYMREVIGGPISVQGFAPQKVLPWIRITGERRRPPEPTPPGTPCCSSDRCPTSTHAPDGSSSPSTSWACASPAAPLRHPRR